MGALDILSSLPPGAEKATDVVSFKVFLNGDVLSASVPLVQIVVNRTFNKIASAKIVFLDGSASDQDFPLSANDKFKPGSKMKVQLGYHGEVDTVFEGVIVKQSVKVRQQGSSLLTIEAKDKSISLTLGRKSAYFNDKTDTQAIESIASDLSPDVENTQLKHKQLVQFESTDWDFIIMRAEANGLLVLTMDGKLIVKSPGTDSAPVLKAEYGKNILEFEAEMDARRQMKDITAYAWNFTEQKILKGTPTSVDFSEPGDMSSKDLAKVLDASVVVSHSGYLTQKQLEAWSMAVDMRQKLSKAAGRVRIEGKASVKPGDMITLSGVGDCYNGDVFVTGVLHQFEGYWQTDIQFGWKEEWFYKKEDVMDKPASGLLPGVNGLQIGTVLDTEDKDGQFRVKVHIPIIQSGNEGIWARVATLDAGKDRGSFFRPKKGDEVVLGFLNDDPRDAVILGCLHSKQEHPSPLPKEKDKPEFGFVTEKTKLVFNDDKKSLTLSVKADAGEKSIVINNADGAIEMKDESGNSIVMGKDGITIKASKDVVIKGTNVMIN
jgi:Rhs element Vgr protein